MVIKAFYLWVASIGFCVLGGIISINTGDWTWLSKAGSLVVVLGIIFAAKKIDSYIKGIRGEPATLKIMGIDLSGPKTSEEKEKLVNFVRQVHKLNEVLILIFGTLVWGFGDLPSKF